MIQVNAIAVNAGQSDNEEKGEKMHEETKYMDYHSQLIGVDPTMLL